MIDKIKKILFEDEILIEEEKYSYILEFYKEFKISSLMDIERSSISKIKLDFDNFKSSDIITVYLKDKHFVRILRNKNEENGNVLKELVIEFYTPSNDIGRNGDLPSHLNKKIHYTNNCFVSSCETIQYLNNTRRKRVGFNPSVIVREEYLEEKEMVCDPYDVSWNRSYHRIKSWNKGNRFIYEKYHFSNKDGNIYTHDEYKLVNRALILRSLKNV